MTKTRVLSSQRRPSGHAAGAARTSPPWNVTPFFFPIARPSVWRLVWGAQALAMAAACGDSGDSPIRIGFVLDGEAASASLPGAQMGIEEAAHAASMVGRAVELATEQVGPDEGVGEAAERLADEGVVAMLGGFDEASCRELSRVAEQRRILFVNIGCRSNELRADTIRYTLHIEASEAMYDAALREFGRSGLLWRGDLERFGARQLNQRYERQFGTQLEPGAWAAWAAVKVIWEVLARSDVVSAEELAASFRDPATRFDGHKGEALTFEPRTLQLQQPLVPSLASASTGDADPWQEVHAALPAISGKDFRGGEYLFVSNEGSRDVTVVDLRSARAVARIPVGNRPRGINLSADGDRLYVAVSDDAPALESSGDGVVGFDLESGATTGRYPVGSDPEQFALTPDGHRLYAANEDAGTATATELATGRVLATSVVGIEPEGIAVSPDGRWVFVTAETSNTVSVLDVAAERVVANFLVDLRPRGVAFSPDGTRAYITNEISSTVSVVDVAARRPMATIRLEPNSKPVGVAVSPDGRSVYIANGQRDCVTIVDAGTNQIVAEIGVGRRPWGITVSADGAFAFTANGVSNDVSQIDLKTRRVLRHIPVGERPWGVALGRAR